MGITEGPMTLKYPSDGCLGCYLSVLGIPPSCEPVPGAFGSCFFDVMNSS